MKAETHSLLLPFFLGKSDERERLEVERLLLTDPEVLLDYLDLKREKEAALLFPETPSAGLWSRLQAPFATPQRKRLSYTLGGALVAGLLVFWVFAVHLRISQESPISSPRVLFDSAGELPASSSVL